VTNSTSTEWTLRLPLALLLAAAISLFLLAACGDDDDGDDDRSPTATTEETPEDTGDAEETPDEGTPEPELPPECDIGEGGQTGLLSDLVFDREDRQYPVGDPVEFTLRLINCGETGSTLHFVNGQRYEFIVENNETGEEIWRWSQGQAFDQAKGQEVIESGEVVEYTGTWDQADASGAAVPEGRYKVSAFSVGCGVESEQACQFGPVRQFDIGIETEEATDAPTEAASS
jgi:hypothetical protein